MRLPHRTNCHTGQIKGCPPPVFCQLGDEKVSDSVTIRIIVNSIVIRKPARYPCGFVCPVKSSSAGASRQYKASDCSPAFL